MRIRRPWTIIALLTACLLLAGSGVLIYKAASVSPATIRAEILALTPIGSSVEDVDKAIDAMQLDNGACWRGDKSEVEVRYARFYEIRRLPFPTVIHAHWHFDAEGKLSDVSLKYYVLMVIVMTEIEDP